MFTPHTPTHIFLFFLDDEGPLVLGSLGCRCKSGLDYNHQIFIIMTTMNCCHHHYHKYQHYRYSGLTQSQHWYPPPPPPLTALPALLISIGLHQQTMNPLIDLSISIPLGNHIILSQLICSLGMSGYLSAHLMYHSTVNEPLGFSI